MGRRGKRILESTEHIVKSVLLCAADRPSPYRYRLTTPVGLLDIGQRWLSLRARSVLARRPVDRTADHYRKKAAEYARQAGSATDETMRAYLCMMRDQWLIVAKAFESRGTSARLAKSHPDPLRHRAPYKFLNCDLAYASHRPRLFRLRG
jgi:hypothetical protein